MPWHELSLGALAVRSWTVFGRAPVLLVLLVLTVAGLRRAWPWRSTLLASAGFA